MSIVTEFILFISIVIIVFTLVAISTELQSLRKVLFSYIEMQTFLIKKRLDGMEKELEEEKNGEKKED